MGKYYVVWKGRKPGVYSNWASAFEQINGYSGARYKGFQSREEAYEAYGGSKVQVSSKEAPVAVQAVSKPPMPVREISLIEQLQILITRFSEKIAQDKAARRRKGT